MPAVTAALISRRDLGPRHPLKNHFETWDGLPDRFVAFKLALPMKRGCICRLQSFGRSERIAVRHMASQLEDRKSTKAYDASAHMAQPRD